MERGTYDDPIIISDDEDIISVSDSEIWFEESEESDEDDVFVPEEEIEFDVEPFLYHDRTPAA